MSLRLTLLVCLLCQLLISPVAGQSPPQAAAEKAPELLKKSIHSSPRAIRRDVPLPNAIRKAFESGTRDFSGRPGPNYWQLQTDFDIQVRLDPATQTLTGSEKILIHNNSPDALDRIVLRLDHNIFRAGAQRGASVPAEITDGMVVTRIALEGQEVDLAANQGRGFPGAEEDVAIQPEK